MTIKLAKKPHRVQINTLNGLHDVQSRYFIEGDRITSITSTVEREVKQSENSDGYLQVALATNENTYRYLSVARIVCTVEHGDCPSPEHQADHIDCNPRNNDPENLQWLTPGENKRRHRRPYKRLHPNAIFFARELRESGEKLSIPKLAAATGVTHRKLKQALDRKTHKNVKPTIDIPANWTGCVVNIVTGTMHVTAHSGSPFTRERVNLRRLFHRMRSKRERREIGIVGSVRTGAFKRGLAKACGGKHPIFSEDAWEILEKHLMRLAREKKKGA